LFDVLFNAEKNGIFFLFYGISNSWLHFLDYMKRNKVWINVPVNLANVLVIGIGCWQICHVCKLVIGIMRCCCFITAEIKLTFWFKFLPVSMIMTRWIITRRIVVAGSVMVRMTIVRYDCSNCCSSKKGCMPGMTD
jgi:hypothetical protein